MKKMAGEKVIVVMVDPEQALEIARHIMEALSYDDCKSIAILNTINPPPPMQTWGDLPEPDIVMIGSVTIVGLPASVEEMDATLERDSTNPTEN